MSTQDDQDHRKLHSDLSRLFERAKLPTNPAIAVRILDLIKDPNSSADNFASVIKGDPALTGRLMKVSNTALYGQRTKVTTLKRAVTVLGLRRIRMVSVGFQLVKHLDRLGGVEFDLRKFWQHSLLRACLARELSEKVAPSLAEEAFLVGLFQDCGVLLLAQIHGSSYSELYYSGASTPTEFYAKEKLQFDSNHIDAIEVMADIWNLPDTIAKPLRQHHQRIRLGGKSGDFERLCAVSYFVGSVCWENEATMAYSEPKLLEYAQTDIKLDENSINACFDQAGKAYRNIAHIFGNTLPDNIDVTELVMEANDLLARATDDVENLAQKAVTERDQLRDEQGDLKTAVAQYRDRAARDPLTGILNRGALLDATIKAMNEAESRHESLTVFFLDIDNFKKLNDTHGHQAGDEVLKGIARTLETHLRNNGFVGRYGGEEFVVIQPNMTEIQARESARELNKSIRQTGFPGLNLSDPVTCSIGAIWGRPKAGLPAESLFASADELMYHAKRNGKDRCGFRSMNLSSAIYILSESVKANASTCGRIDAEERRQDDIILGSEGLQRLAEELNQQHPERFVNARKQERIGLLTPCVLSFLTGPSLEVGSENAYVRNISAGGVGLLVMRQMVRGDLIEVAMNTNKGTTYVAGQVAFCRHVKANAFEAGVQLINRSEQPVFSSDFAHAMSEFEWIKDAVAERYGEDDHAKRTA